MTILIFIPLTIIAGVGETIAQAVRDHHKAYRPRPHTFN